MFDKLANININVSYYSVIFRVISRYGETPINKYC